MPRYWATEFVAYTPTGSGWQPDYPLTNIATLTETPQLLSARSTTTDQQTITCDFGSETMIAAWAVLNYNKTILTVDAVDTTVQQSLRSRRSQHAMLQTINGDTSQVVISDEAPREEAVYNELGLLLFVESGSLHTLPASELRARTRSAVFPTLSFGTHQTRLNSARVRRETWTFRLASSNAAQLEELAGLYGGIPLLTWHSDEPEEVLLARLVESPEIADFKEYIETTLELEEMV